MKSTPLTEVHIALGAKMVEYAGYSMPVSYQGIREEHLAVRNGVGVFDVSHMGEFIINGKGALELIQYISSNDASKLEIGEAQYSCMPNANGGIVDDMLVYRLDEDKCAEGERAYMLVVNAANMQKDWDWIDANNNFDCQLENISSECGLLAIQGPKSVEVLQKLCSVDLSEIKYYTFRKMRVADIDNVLVSATGYTGSGGFELYVRNEHLVPLWNALFSAGDSENIVPAGLGARDTLRLEMGYCLYGNDIDDSTSPIEAGLSWITKLKKGEFVSREIFTTQKEGGVERKLVGFILNDRRVPRQDYPLYSTTEQLIGYTTSGTMSPSLDRPIGMGYVQTGFHKPGTEIFVQARKKLLKAEIVRLPFYKPD